MSEQQQIDWVSFFVSVVIVLAVSIPLAASPESAGELLQVCYDFIAQKFGFLYLLAGCSTLGVLIWLAFGRFGSITLGEQGETPEFSMFSWSAMLFCGGIGATIMYWGTIEWAYYYTAPPVRHRSPHSTCSRVGVDLRHVSLGCNRLGYLLLANHRHCLSLLRQKNTLPAI